MSGTLLVAEELKVPSGTAPVLTGSSPGKELGICKAVSRQESSGCLNFS